MEIEINEIELVSLPTKKPQEELRDKYLKVYRCWQEIWMMEFGKNYETKDFISFEEVVALFYKGECVGFCFLDHKDSSSGPVTYCRMISIHSKFRVGDTTFSWPSFFSHSLEQRFKGKKNKMIFDKRQGTEAMKLGCPLKKAS